MGDSPTALRKELYARRNHRSEPIEEVSLRMVAESEEE